MTSKRLLASLTTVLFLLTHVCVTGQEPTPSPVALPSAKATNTSDVFAETGGIVAVEAEHFIAQHLDDVRTWHRIDAESVEQPDAAAKEYLDAASGSAYVRLLPDTRKSHADKMIVGENFAPEPGKLAILDYQVKFETPGRYYVWVRAFSVNSEDNGIHVGLDGEWPEHGKRMQWCKGKKQWYWESRQRTKQKHCGVEDEIYLDIETPGVHTISFSMREDGFAFDRWLMTTDRDFLRPTDAGPASIVAAGAAPALRKIDAKSATNDSTSTAKDAALTGKVNIVGEQKLWHKITLACTGPDTNETATPNPFRDFRLNATFKHPASGKEYQVPGHYAADGNAGETSGDSGNQWHVHFCPDETGQWEYALSFRAGNFIAASEREGAGKSAGFVDGKTGSFEVSESDKTGRDFRSQGRLEYVGGHYLKFAGSGELFLKCGADAPENLLAFADFDGDFKTDGHKDELVKTWEPHVHDWTDGDPVWQGGKGKGLVGAISYLSSQGMNSISFLTLNILGDDQNVFPYINYDERERFDVSRLAQWEIVFAHAQAKGMYLHFKTQEHENEGMLDGGGTGLHRKMYYRELISRFGHHLALNWNLGEECGEWGRKSVSLGQDSVCRRAMAEYFYDHDPYHHLIVIHNGRKFDDMLGDLSKLTGVSVQTNQKDFSKVHAEVLKWRTLSDEAGRPWVVACDEPGDAQDSLLPDDENPDHDNARKNALWGTLMAGGAGVEWYFGYAHPHSDLTCQDWRSREKMWQQGKYALDFFREAQLPLEKMVPDDALTESPDDYCFYAPGEAYVIYLKSGGNAAFDLSDVDGDFDVRWFNPRNGEFVGESSTISGGGEVSVGPPPVDAEKDWVVLLQRSGS